MLFRRRFGVKCPTFVSRWKWLLVTVSIITVFILAMKRNQTKMSRNEINRPASTVVVSDVTRMASPASISLTRNSQLTNTSKIFYNRVPKCASTTLVHLFKFLGKRKGFRVLHSRVYAELILNDTRQAEFVKWFSSELEGPVIFDRHLHFIDFTRFSVPNPIYINLIRDPLERLVSSYYFIRNHLQSMFPLGEERRKMSFDECVAHRLPECVRDGRPGYFEVIPFFCGQHKFCNSASEQALSAAKANVARHYTVIGVLEDFHDFLEALELSLPSFFRDARKVFNDSQAFLHIHETDNSEKKLPNKTTVKFMKEKLKYDYDFYNFIRARLQNTLTHYREQRPV